MSLGTQKGDPEPGTRVLKAAGAMGVATLISRVLGLVREQVFAVLFGAGPMMDAFNVAFRIPNLLRDLLAEGAMSAALVPTFVAERERQGIRRAWRLAGLVFRSLTGVGVLLALLGIIFADPLVDLYASAFRENPQQFDLTVLMTRIMFPYFPLVVLGAAFMGILNACGTFFLPALSSALFNAVSICVGVGLTFLVPRWGFLPIVGMAMGVVAGGLVQAFFQLPVLYGKGYAWQRRLDDEPPWFRDPALKNMLALMAPALLGQAAAQVNILVNTMLATSQGSGAVSWLSYAFRLLQFPIGVFGVSLAVATLPRISRQWVQNDFEGIRITLDRTLRQVLAINLPAAAGLCFLGAPVIQLIFEYGRFSSSDTTATAHALAAYSVGLAAYSSVKVLVPACYGMGNTRIPVISSILAVGVNVALNLLLVHPLGYWGLALGMSAAALVNCIFLLFAVKKILRAKGGDFPILPLLRTGTGYLLLSVSIGLICLYSRLPLDHWLSDVRAMQWLGHWGVPFIRTLKVVFSIFEAVFLLILSSKIFKLKEIDEVLVILFKKFKIKLTSQNP